MVKQVFNVGGGIVIDSEPEKEYEESLLKAQALLTALRAASDSTKQFEELLRIPGVQMCSPKKGECT